MNLGAFSVSLAVKDLQRSRDFYERLGFTVSGGSAEEKYLIMAHGETIIGIFEGMFEGNILTFNPGLNNRMEQLTGFDDVRDIQGALQAAGIELLVTADPQDSGPAHITLQDPDGNAILIDQFFPRPGST